MISEYTPPPSATGGGTVLTADNGLTLNIPTNVQLGGTLIHDTTIDCGALNFVFKTNALFSVGDVDGTANKTVFTVEENTKRVFVRTDLTFVVQDTSFNAFFDVDTSIQLVTFGDLGFAYNSTRFILNDVAGEMKMEMTTQLIISNPAGQQIIAAYPGNFDVFMGDVNTTSTGTRMEVTDSVQRIRMYSPGTVEALDITGNLGFNCDLSGKIVSLGDLSNSANATKFIVDDSASSITGTITNTFEITDIPGALVFRLNAVIFSAAFGDVGGAVNNTKMIVDDSRQLVTITNVPAFANDLAATGAGLTTGDLYKLTLAGITQLNIVP